MLIAFTIVLGGFHLSLMGDAHSQPPPGSNVRFNIAPRYNLGTDTFDETIADFDGDGNLDIAAVNAPTQTPRVSIVFGDGNGGFSAPLVILSTLIPRVVTAGDFNHDGRPDIVVGAYYQNQIAFISNLGNRQFGSPVISFPPEPPFPNTAQFYDLGVGDFNHDGNLDVVALQDQQGKRLRFFSFSGQGTLTVYRTLYAVGQDNSYEGTMDIADLNGDNWPDVILAAGGPFGPRNVSFVMSQVEASLDLIFAFETIDIPVGFGIVDVDGDSDKDLIIAFADQTTPTQHSVQTFVNAGGAFSAGNRIAIDYPFEPRHITAGDYNNDGKPDFAALIGAMLMVSYGRGGGTFTPATYYAVSNANLLFSVDVNHDNELDILVLTTQFSDRNSVSVLENLGDAGFRAPQATPWGPTFIDAADFNGDGYKEFVSSWQTTYNNTSGVDILINDRNGGLLPEISYPSPAALSGMKTGDFNGDGKADAVTCHSYNSRQIALYFGNGTGTVATPILTPFSDQLTNIFVADFNSDGKDDVFVVDENLLGKVMLSTGFGTFTLAPGSPISILDSIVELHGGDFNNDQHPDLVVARDAAITLWMGSQSGQLTQSMTTIPNLSHAVPGDFNGDGWLDLAGVTGELVIGVLGNGDGTFANSFSIPHLGGVLSTRSIVSADFDRDGFDDLALIMENQYGNLLIFTSGGSTPSWKPPIFYDVGNATRTLITADFDSDGRPDLGYLGANSRGILYNNLGTTRRRSPFDFDGDSRTDIAIFRPGPGEWWWQRSSNGSNGAATFGNSTDKLVPGDYTGDGKADIAVWRPSNGNWYVLRSEDFSFYAFPYGTTGDTPVPADYDGDGNFDAAVFRPSNVMWFISRSTGGDTIQTFGAAGDVPVPSDYDGDAKADIAIFRPSLGQWWLQRSTAGTVAYQFGQSTDKTVEGDFTGDGKSDVAFWRPSTGEWYVLRSENNSFYAFPFGAAADLAVPGDYDGDGKFDAAVFRPSSSTWYAQRSTAGTLIQQFGITGDVPVPSVFVR